MGCNKLGQLGIDTTLSIALQPMYINGLDNKIITQISAGQHHNAVVADDQLYTWGWNVYGQCGQNVVKNILQPRVVDFFCNKVKLKINSFCSLIKFVLFNRKLNKLFADKLIQLYSPMRKMSISTRAFMHLVQLIMAHLEQAMMAMILMRIKIIR